MKSTKHIILDHSLILQKVDVKAGDLTFGNRIQLGKIFERNSSDFDKFRETFTELHGLDAKVSYIKELMPYYIEIIDGLKYWIEMEKMLRYTPTSEELQAGIKELGEKIGDYSTVKSLAKEYGKDPDEILAWKYSKVFGILYTDLEEHKFQKKYQQIIEQKYKIK